MSTCERTSLVSSIYAGLRYDNRKFLEVRDITINFGKDYGSCTATLGETRVLAQVRTESTVLLAEMLGIFKGIPHI